MSPKIHPAESSGNDIINDIVLLTRLAIYVDPSKLKLRISNEGTIVIARTQMLRSQYSNVDLQEIGLYPAITVGKYIKCIHGRRVYVTATAVEEVVAGISKMTRDHYVSTQRELREFVHSYFDFRRTRTT